MPAPGLRIGLTGGIGSGKSTVANLLAALGSTLVDTDAIARELTLSGGVAIDPIRAAFGAGVIDASGALDRPRMRDLAFTDSTARRRLEAILHPLIGAESERRAAAADGTSIVFDVPLLTESAHWRARVDKVLVVDCSEATQIQRVVDRSGWTPEHVQAVITQQASRVRRRAVADAVIFNEQITLDVLEAHVQALARWWRMVPADGRPVEQ